MANNKQISAGDDIDSRCLKCKAVTNHTIIAMIGAKVAKVQCNTCHSPHNYRPPSVEKSTTVRRTAGKTVTGRTTKPRISKEMAAASLFEDVLAARDFSTAMPYRMSGDFNPNDILNHPSFGFGVVTKKISSTRIEVCFKEGSKILVCSTS
ncbi:MAG: hypothetical protein V1706_01120 [Pseudomonadota bacterium]